MATYTQILSVAFGQVQTGKAASIRCKVVDSAGVTQIAATNTPDTVNSFAEELDAAGNATTGIFATPCTTFNSAWLPARVLFTISGVAGVAAEVVLPTSFIAAKGMDVLLTDVTSDADMRSSGAKMLRGLFNRWFNVVQQTATTQTVLNDSNATTSTMTTSDDGTTAIKGKSA